MSKKIFASNDKTKYTLVDDDIADIIQDMNLKFYIMNNGYFQLTKWIKLPCMTEKKQLLLHHFVFILKTGNEPTLSIDHIDIDKSNNQFKNLRLATIQQQQQHRGRQKNNISGLIGVCHINNKHNKRRKNWSKDYWRARIRKPSGKNESKLFPYTSEGRIAAGRWYDTKAREYFGNFVGQLNFPMQDDKQ